MNSRKPQEKKDKPEIKAKPEIYEYEKVYKVVLDALQIKTEEGKTIAEAMIDGSITEEDLKRAGINSENPVFLANNFNRNELPEGAYNSKQAMEQFVAILSPFLSDQALYHVTHLLTKIEVETITQEDAIYRRTTLAVFFAREELRRHLKYRLKEGKISTTLPDPFLSHMHDYVLPIKRDEKQKEEMINTMVGFSFLRLMPDDVRQKYDSDMLHDYRNPQEEAKFNPYKQVNTFDKKSSFIEKELGKKAEKEDPNARAEELRTRKRKFNARLAGLEERYRKIKAEHDKKKLEEQHREKDRRLGRRVRRAVRNTGERARALLGRVSSNVAKGGRRIQETFAKGKPKENNKENEEKRPRQSSRVRKIIHLTELAYHQKAKRQARKQEEPKLGKRARRIRNLRKFFQLDEQETKPSVEKKQEEALQRELKQTIAKRNRDKK